MIELDELNYNFKGKECSGGLAYDIIDETFLLNIIVTHKNFKSTDIKEALHAFDIKLSEISANAAHRVINATV